MEHIDIDHLQKKFTDLYNCEPEVVSRAPGRAEIIGNHTDYNNGFALSCGISRYTRVATGKNNTRKIRVFSDRFSEGVSEFDIDHIEKGPPGYWLNYTKGVVVEIQKLSDVRGADIYIESDVPSSGGVSSSAALELSVATALCELFGIEIEHVEKARMCQKAENGPLVGIPCGFLDQASSGLAQKDHLLFLDFLPDKDMPVSHVRQIPFSLKKHEMSFVVVVDKEVKRNLGSSGYPARRKMCEESVPILAKMLSKKLSSLRDVSIDEFESCRTQLDNIDEVMRKRVEHVVYENQRVLDAVEALKSNDIEKFGEILTASGKSALELYALDEKTPELTRLVISGRTIDGVVGMRNMGGGFSAIALALVKQGSFTEFQQKLNTAYGDGLEYIPFDLSQGAEVVARKNIHRVNVT